MMLLCRISTNILCAATSTPQADSALPRNNFPQQSPLQSVPPSDSLVRYGISLMDARKYEAAQDAFEEALKLNPSNSEAHCRLCQMEIVQGKNLERAENYCLKAVYLTSNNADYYYWLGAVYGLQALNGELIDALAVASRLRDAFQRALKINPKHSNARFAMAQYYLQAPQ